MKRSMVIDIVVFLYIVLFLYTGISKLLDYRVFSSQISESPILKPFSSALAIGLPVLELALVGLLFIPKYRLLSLYSSLVLMVLFTLYIIGIMIFFEHLPCSCGGVLAELSWLQHLIFNAVFVALAVLAIFLEKLRRKNIKISTTYEIPKQVLG